MMTARSVLRELGQYARVQDGRVPNLQTVKGVSSCPLSAPPVAGGFLK